MSVRPRPRIRRPAALTGIVAAAALVLSGCAGATQKAATSDWPNKKPITLLVGFAPGGPADGAARPLAQSLEKELGTPVEVVNKPGATGQVAYGEIARAKPDGLTFGMVNYPSFQTSYLDSARKAGYTRDDFTTLANHVTDARVLVVQPDAPFKNLKEFIAAAKREPRKFTAGTAGKGSGAHFSAIQFEDATGTDLALTHFAEGSGPSAAAFLGKHIDVLFAGVSDVDQMAKDGTGKVIGVMTEERSEFLPDVPTFKEQGVNVMESGQRGFVGPAGLPKDIQDKLSAALAKVIKSEENKEALRKLGLESHYLDPAQYDADLKASEAKYRGLLPKIGRP
ncbi:MAG: tripartite tricarboxylate transporter substrate binding protein [Streptosporangiales bacterium]|nr:tripartite tricarboxylate transporter substrate binding protein [Streptosporangiales bacterium]